MDQRTNSIPTFREAVCEDAPSIAAIYNQAIDQGSCTMDVDHWTSAMVVNRIETKGERESCLVAEMQTPSGLSEVVAWGAIRKYSDRRGYSVCCETALYVDEQFHRRGVGQKTIDEIVTRCVSLGYRHAVAKVLAENQQSIRFHERNRFEVVGVQNEIGYLNDRWQDVVVMQRLFREVKPPSNHSNSIGIGIL